MFFKFSGNFGNTFDGFLERAREFGKFLERTRELLFPGEGKALFAARSILLVRLIFLDGREGASCAREEGKSWKIAQREYFSLPIRRLFLPGRASFAKVLVYSPFYSGPGNFVSEADRKTCFLAASILE